MSSRDSIGYLAQPSAAAAAAAPLVPVMGWSLVDFRNQQARTEEIIKTVKKKLASLEEKIEAEETLDEEREKLVIQCMKLETGIKSHEKELEGLRRLIQEKEDAALAHKLMMEEKEDAALAHQLSLDQKLDIHSDNARFVECQINQLEKTLQIVRKKFLDIEKRYNQSIQKQKELCDYRQNISARLASLSHGHEYLNQGHQVLIGTQLELSGVLAAVEGYHNQLIECARIHASFLLELGEIKRQFPEFNAKIELILKAEPPLTLSDFRAGSVSEVKFLQSAMSALTSSSSSSSSSASLVEDRKHRDAKSSQSAGVSLSGGFSQHLGAAAAAMAAPLPTLFSQRTSSSSNATSSSSAASSSMAGSQVSAVSPASLSLSARSVQDKKKEESGDHKKRQAEIDAELAARLQADEWNVQGEHKDISALSGGARLGSSSSNREAVKLAKHRMECLGEALIFIREKVSEFWRQGAHNDQNKHQLNASNEKLEKEINLLLNGPDFPGGLEVFSSKHQLFLNNKLQLAEHVANIEFIATQFSCIAKIQLIFLNELKKIKDEFPELSIEVAKIVVAHSILMKPDFEAISSDAKLLKPRVPSVPSAPAPVSASARGSVSASASSSSITGRVDQYSRSGFSGHVSFISSSSPSSSSFPSTSVDPGIRDVARLAEEFSLLGIDARGGRSSSSNATSSSSAASTGVAGSRVSSSSFGPGFGPGFDPGFGPSR